MPKKVWTSKEKLQVVLDGVKGMTVPEICRQHGIAQPMCCRWADQFLANAESIFGNSSSKKESKLERENNQLRQIVADQALELKKCCDGKKKKNIRVGCNSQQRASLAYRIHQMRSSFLGIQESLCDNPLQAWPQGKPQAHMQAHETALSDNCEMGERIKPDLSVFSL